MGLLRCIAAGALLWLQFVVLCPLVNSQGILTEDEAVYHPPKPAKTQVATPSDPFATLIRSAVHDSVPIEALLDRIPVNESIRGVPYHGFLAVKKGLLEGLSDVSQRGRPLCHADNFGGLASSTVLFSWPRVRATFSVRAYISGIRVFGLAGVEFKPVFVETEIQETAVLRFEPSPVRVLRVTVSALKGFNQTRVRLQKRLAHASRKALRHFLATEVRRALVASLERAANDVSFGDSPC
ncbi:hypothetical protein IscW_ISCW020517 [Ixodes scapularis]|uniref:Secreted protein n=1 Tax=Ixodes scapularis TaxID=6945 RepID=B7Q1F7_IXOSC|nr:hypothetical protein IscW_ISCW020517 [Ixodes scapularis]|eukprot:XP_002409596.1 hypothetical protein IscW_ISCW020517 [Ixodes scapularis]